MGKEIYQIKHDFKMPDGRVIHCTYEKAIKKLRSGKYGDGDLKELELTKAGYRRQNFEEYQ